MRNPKVGTWLATLLLVASSGVAHALMGLEFAPPLAGIALPDREANFEFTNNDVTRVLEFSITTVDGKPVPAETALAYPPVATVVSGAKQAVRVLWRGPLHADRPQEFRLLVRTHAPAASPYEAQLNNVAVKTALSMRVFVYNKNAKPKLVGRLLRPDPAKPEEQVLELENQGDGIGRVQLLQWANGARLFQGETVMPRDHKRVTIQLPANASGELKILVEHQGWIVVQ